MEEGTYEFKTTWPPGGDTLEGWNTLMEEEKNAQNTRHLDSTVCLSRSAEKFLPLFFDVVNRELHSHFLSVDHSDHRRLS